MIFECYLASVESNFEPFIYVVFNTGLTTSSRHSKNVKLQPVHPSMASESLSVRLSGTNSASNHIDGGTSWNYCADYM